MKHLLTGLILLFALSALAQEFDIRSFAADPSDLSARKEGRRTVNDEPCALVKVLTNIRGLQFESNIGIVDVVHKEDGYWVYVAPRERQIELYATGFLPGNVRLPEPAVEFVTYLLVIETKTYEKIPSDRKEIRLEFNIENVIVLCDNGDEYNVRSKGDKLKIAQNVSRLVAFKEGYEPKIIEFNQLPSELISIKLDRSLPYALDGEGNRYDIVKIGTQEWLSRDLQTKSFNNGDAVSQWTPDNDDASSLSTDPHYFSILTTVKVKATNGRGDVLTYKLEGSDQYLGLKTSHPKADTFIFYNWLVVNDQRNICPSGWRISTDDDWNLLEKFFPDPQTAGTKLKARKGWYGDNGENSGESGFQAQASGYYNSEEGYELPQGLNCWWLPKAMGTQMAYAKMLIHDSDEIGMLTLPKSYGLSIRCIKSTPYELLFNE